MLRRSFLKLLGGVVGVLGLGISLPEKKVEYAFVRPTETYKFPPEGEVFFHNDALDAWIQELPWIEETLRVIEKEFPWCHTAHFNNQVWKKNGCGGWVYEGSDEYDNPWDSPGFDDHQLVKRYA